MSEEKFKKFPVPLGWERPLYQLIGSKKAQVQTLRVHIEKSNRRTYFYSAINLIIRVSSNSEEKVRKFSPCGLDGLFFWFVYICCFCFDFCFVLFVCWFFFFFFCLFCSCFLFCFVLLCFVINLIIRVSSNTKKLGNFPVSFNGRGRFNSLWVAKSLKFKL